VVIQNEQLEARAKALEMEGSEDESGSPKHSKSARAYAKTYKPGPPLVPALIVERISTYISKVIIRKKVDFLHMMCKYWSLKREARRGAPLLKRLHLEPWTAFNNAKTYSEEEKGKKLEVRIYHPQLMLPLDIPAVVSTKTA
jgi:NuA3 HAT complex component NTO1